MGNRRLSSPFTPQTLPDSQIATLCATSCVRGAHVTLLSWGVDHPFNWLLPQVNVRRPSLSSLPPSDLSGDNRYSLLCFPHD